jgi:hypothetical protein
MMKLVYSNDNEPVRVGDIILTFRNEMYELESMREPHHSGSTGRVYVKPVFGNDSSREFFPSVVGAEWVPDDTPVPEDLRQKMADIQGEIFAHRYYVEIYKRILSQLQITSSNISAMKYPRERVIRLAHYFWNALPDSPAVRREPFFKLCDIAENISG